MIVVSQSAITSLVASSCEGTFMCSLFGATGCLPTSTGVTYMGTVSRTRSNLTCQPWTQTALRSSNSFPEGSARLAMNYCRNPTNPNISPRPGPLPDGVWCYTFDLDVPWEMCNVTVCRELLCLVCLRSAPRIKNTEYRISNVFIVTR